MLRSHINHVIIVIVYNSRVWIPRACYQTNCILLIHVRTLPGDSNLLPHTRTHSLTYLLKWVSSYKTLGHNWNVAVSLNKEKYISFVLKTF